MAIIRRIRLERGGLSQEALALLAEIDQSYLGQVERADNNVTMLVLVLARLAKALGVKVAQLMAEAGL